MTLLVLDLHIPVVTTIRTEQVLWAQGALQSEQALWIVLGRLAPSLLAYFMSFLTLGIFWVAQQTQINHFASSDRNLTWIHLAFLLAVALMPFSTALLAAFITYRLAIAVYWLNLLLLGVVLFISLRYACGAGLVKATLTLKIRAANERRIVIYQALYACGAVLSVFNTYVSIAFIILTQLNSALAPRIRLLNRF